jgi:uncharacterized membrane protein
MTLARFIAAASIAWPVFLAAGWWSGAHGGPVWVTSVVYLSAGRVCHQRPDRSFTTSGVHWPVCGRCAGLYLAAPLGVAAAFAWRRRRAAGMPAVAGLLVAALPTAVTLVLEWTGVSAVSSAARAIAAVPLGAAVGFYLIAAAGSRAPSGTLTPTP